MEVLFINGAELGMKISGKGRRGQARMREKNSREDSRQGRHKRQKLACIHRCLF